MSNATTKQRKPRTPEDPTIKAMKQLNRIFSELNREQLSMVLNWALDKHKDKNIKSVITT